MYDTPGQADRCVLVGGTDHDHWITYCIGFVKPHTAKLTMSRCHYVDSIYAIPFRITQSYGCENGCAHRSHNRCRGHMHDSQSIWPDRGAALPLILCKKAAKHRKNSVAQGESGRLISEISTYRSHDRNVVLLSVFVLHHSWRLFELLIRAYMQFESLYWTHWRGVV